MVKMRKKLSSAVRGIRKQLSSKPGKAGTLQDESEAPSPEDSVVAQLHTVMDSEQGRDVDMTVVEEKISVADVAERDDVDEDNDEEETKKSTVENSEAKENSTASETEKEENDGGSVTPSISASATETDVELELAGDEPKPETGSLIDNVEEDEEEKPDDVDEKKEVKEDDEVADVNEPETETREMDESPESTVEGRSKDGDDVVEEQRSVDEMERSAVANSGDEVSVEKEDYKVDEKTTEEDEDVGVPENSAPEPVMEEVPLEKPEEAKQPESSAPSQEEDMVVEEEPKADIPADTSLETEVIPRSESSRSEPKMKIEHEKLPQLAFCCF